MESDPRVILARENQERALILLPAALCPLKGELGHENHGPHVRGATFGIDWNRRGEEGTVGVPLFIAGRWARRTNVRWDTLSDDLYPIAISKIIPVSWCYAARCFGRKVS